MNPPQSPLKPQKVALVHNWLTIRGGSENVLFEMAKIFPDAPIYTLVYDAKKFPEFKNRQVITSWLQHIPWLRWHHEFFPPIRYLIWRYTKLKGYDLVISNSSSENKAVRTPGAFHLSYIHTPPHYYWRYANEYLANPGFGALDPLVRIVLKIMNPLLRSLDKKAAQNPDKLLANSKFIAGQVKNYYGRESTVLYPPVDTQRFSSPTTPPTTYHLPSTKPYYLAFGRQTVFKRFDLVINAFNELGLPLKVAGTGPENKKLREMAKGNIEFLGYVSDKELASLVNQAKACVFANEEDFGITWVESMAAGTPVICYGSGGALETVLDGQTGILFSNQTADSLNKAIQCAEKTNWDYKLIKSHVSQFSKPSFQKNMQSLLNKIRNPISF